MLRLFRPGHLDRDEIARILGIGRATCYRYISQAAGTDGQGGWPLWPIQGS
jgi:transposase